MLEEETTRSRAAALRRSVTVSCHSFDGLENGEKKDDRQ